MVVDVVGMVELSGMFVVVFVGVWSGEVKVIRGALEVTFDAMFV